MDATLADVFTRVARSLGCSVDDILESPEFRAIYLAEARRLLGHLQERELLHRLVCLRKAGKLPKTRDLAAAKQSSS